MEKIKPWGFVGGELEKIQYGMVVGKIAFVVLIAFMSAHYEQLLVKIYHIMMANRTVYLTGSWKTLFHSKAVICEKT